jgi:hypothetical protein
MSGGRTKTVAATLVAGVLQSGCVGGPPKPSPPTTTAAPSVLPPAPAAARAATTFRGTARSLEFRGTVTVPRIEVVEAGVVFVTGNVVDAAGRSLGRGRVGASGPGTSVQAAAISYHGALRMTPGQVRLHGGDITWRGHLTMSSPQLSFLPDIPVDRPVEFTEPVRVSGASSGTVGSALVAGTPAELRLGDEAGDARLSWAGDGAVDLPGYHTFTGEWLGIVATRLSATVRVADLAVSGEASVRQVHVDGWPRLPAIGVGVDLLKTPGPVPPGAEGWFRWALRNGGEIEMAITRIRPVNGPARWVTLALSPLPSVYAGERGPLRGGDTRGLREFGPRYKTVLGGWSRNAAVPINSVIPPGAVDEPRGISFYVPEGTPPGRYELALRVEGNFPPFTVTVPFEVPG